MGKLYMFNCDLRAKKKKASGRDENEIGSSSQNTHLNMLFQLDETCYILGNIFYTRSSGVFKYSKCKDSIQHLLSNIKQRIIDLCTQEQSSKIKF
jgi:hypothetical protein